MTDLRSVSLNELQGVIVKPGIEEKLVPLLHFKGHANLGRIHRLWNLAVSMMLHEAPHRTAGQHLCLNPDYAQLCLPICRPDALGLWSFFSRLQLQPQVTNNIAGLLDYARFICPRPFDLTPVSEHTNRRDGAWWRTYKSRPRKPRTTTARSADLVYPYLIHKPREEHGLMMRVNRAVPKSIPEHIRADVCQDLIVAVLEGAIREDDLEDSSRSYITKVFRMFPVKYGPLSLDAPLPGSEDGRSLIEMLT